MSVCASELACTDPSKPDAEYEVATDRVDDALLPEEAASNPASMRMPMPSALLLRECDRTGNVLHASPQLSLPPRVVVQDVYTSICGRTRVSLHASHGNIYEISGYWIDAVTDECIRVPLTLLSNMRIGAGSEMLLVAEYPPGGRPVYPSHVDQLFFQWSSVRDTSPFVRGCCDLSASLPEVTGYLATGDALRLPEYWNDEECDRCELDRTMQSSFTLLLQGPGGDTIQPSQISLVPVTAGTGTGSTEAAMTAAPCTVSPDFAVLSITKAAPGIWPVEGTTAFTVSCMRSVQSVPRAFYVCIGGAITGRPLDVNQVPPARVRASHCATADEYWVRLTGETTDGSGHTAMHQWPSLIAQSLFQIQRFKIPGDGSLLVSFSRANIERELERAGDAHILFMCGATCVWALDRLPSTHHFLPVMTCAPTSWTVVRTEAVEALKPGQFAHSRAIVRVFGSRDIWAPCCTFPGLIKGGLGKCANASGGYDLYIDCDTKFNLKKGCNLLNWRLTCNGVELVQNESSALADLTWLRKNLYISSIDKSFMCIYLNASSVLSPHTFDNAKMITTNTFILPIQSGKSTGSVNSLSARGVVIDRMVVFPNAAPVASELVAVVIYGKNTSWLILLRKCLDAYWPLEPAHFSPVFFSNVHLHLETPDAPTITFKMNVNEIGAMPHRMVCAQLPFSKAEDSKATTVVKHGGISLHTTTWSEPEMQASDFNSMSSDALKTRITNSLPADLKIRFAFI